MGGLQINTDTQAVRPAALAFDLDPSTHWLGCPPCWLKLASLPRALERGPRGIRTPNRLLAKEVHYRCAIGPYLSGSRTDIQPQLAPPGWIHHLEADSCVLCGFISQEPEPVTRLERATNGS